MTVKWDLFNDRVQQIPTTAIDPAGPFLGSIETSNPTFEWRNFLSTYREPRVSAVVLDDGRSMSVSLLSALLPVIALGTLTFAIRPALLSRSEWVALSGASVAAASLSLRVAVVDVANPLAGPPSKAASTQILTGVLNNVNRAYIEKDPAALRQALEIVVASEGLSGIEEELARALRRRRFTLAMPLWMLSSAMGLARPSRRRSTFVSPRPPTPIQFCKTIDGMACRLSA